MRPGTVRREAGGMRRNSVAALAALMLCMTFSTSHASPGTPQDSAPQAAALSSADEARYQELINQLRCLVCQNQTIADSNAPLAADLRDQVRRQLEAGHSDAQIKRYLTDRYGDFVLYKPPFKPQTWLLWLGPFLILLLALLLALRFAHRRQPVPAAGAPDPQALRTLLEEEARSRPGSERGQG